MRWRFADTLSIDPSAWAVPALGRDDTKEAPSLGRDDRVKECSG